MRLTEVAGRLLIPLWTRCGVVSNNLRAFVAMGAEKVRVDPWFLQNPRFCSMLEKLFRSATLAKKVLDVEQITPPESLRWRHSPPCSDHNAKKRSGSSFLIHSLFRPPDTKTNKMKDVQELTKKIIGNVEKVIVGKRPQLIQALVAWYCEGHILLEDVPGVAKTMLARAMARSIGCDFKRIQCTPDLLPTDITGGSIFNQKANEFEFRSGPLFTNLLLADEINRATPRTQAALLEAMAEGRISVDGKTYTLEPPFLIIATQNPVDHEGTFPLPEAQLDRFLVKLSLGYPTIDEEEKLLGMLQHQHPIDSLEPVVSSEQLVAVQKKVREVYVDPKINRYILEIVHQTRDHEDLRLGGSPRASIALFRTSQAMAAIRGRNFVQPDDVKRIAPSVLTHRVILQPESRLRKMTAAGIITEAIADIAVPILTAEPSEF